MRAGREQHDVLGVAIRGRSDVPEPVGGHVALDPDVEVGGLGGGRNRVVERDAREDTRRRHRDVRRDDRAGGRTNGHTLAVLVAAPDQVSELVPSPDSTAWSRGAMLIVSPLRCRKPSVPVDAVPHCEPQNTRYTRGVPTSTPMPSTPPPNVNWLGAAAAIRLAAGRAPVPPFVGRTTFGPRSCSEAGRCAAIGAESSATTCTRGAAAADEPAFADHAGPDRTANGLATIAMTPRRPTIPLAPSPHHRSIEPDPWPGIIGDPRPSRAGPARGNAVGTSSSREPRRFRARSAAVVPGGGTGGAGHQTRS